MTHNGILLIEPVWNRNAVSGGTTRSDDTLLIEPVWNRNSDNSFMSFACSSTFNRTSMESKVVYLESGCVERCRDQEIAPTRRETIGRKIVSGRLRLP